MNSLFNRLLSGEQVGQPAARLEEATEVICADAGVEMGEERRGNFIVKNMERGLKTLEGEKGANSRDHGRPVRGGAGAHGEGEDGVALFDEGNGDVAMPRG